MNIDAKKIRQLTELAFALEPLLDKEGCTTRYTDLAGKPLADFIVAAINIGPAVEDFAEQALAGNMRMFSHFQQAILSSNDYKAKKYISTGLLHFLFITICVRLESQSLDEAISNYIPVMQKTTNQDVRDFVAGMSTSWNDNPKKSRWVQARKEILADAASYYELQSTLYKNSTDTTSSSYQVTKQAYEGFPIIGRFINEIDEKIGLVKSIETTYGKIHRENLDLKIGVLADLSASALFLYLSYQNPDAYIIR